MGAHPPEWFRTVDGKLATYPPDPDEVPGVREGDIERRSLVIAYKVSATNILIVLGGTKFPQDEVCEHRSVEMMLHCVLPVGHEAPHLAQTKEDIHRRGQVVVTRMALVDHNPDHLMSVMSGWDESSC